MPITTDIEGINRYLLGFDGSIDKLCRDPQLHSQLACLSMTGSDAAGANLLRLSEHFPAVPCTAESNQNQDWQLALALDQMKAHLPQLHFDALQQRLISSLQQCLRVLDENSASLWHGRFSLGAEAFLVAASLPEQGVLLERAFYHFHQSILALSLTEGWPGGYNYWIQNRGLTFFLAVQAYLHSGQDHELKAELVKLATRNALWHIYLTRPDGQIQPTGDEGSRVDLKEESKKVIDLLAKITGEPAVATFADYIQQQHGRSSYHSSYLWLIPFVYDPSLEYLSTKDRGLGIFDGWLPNQAIFGPGFFNQIVLRSGWQTTDSFVLINAGQQFSHHQHADAGHFTYFTDGKPVTVDGAFYDTMLSDNRRHYGIRSNAKNLLNLSASDAESQSLFSFSGSQQDGSQHVLMPSGSAVLSVNDWLMNNNYQRARLMAYQPGEPSHIELDLTPAYLRNQNKQALIVRQFSFYASGRLTIRDRISQLDGVVISHLNLPDLTQSSCIDSQWPLTIPLRPRLHLTVNSTSAPACQAQYTQNFMAKIAKHLRQQQNLVVGKAWSDGPFKMLAVAMQADHNPVSIEFDFVPQSAQ